MMRATRPPMPTTSRPNARYAPYPPHPTHRHSQDYHHHHHHHRSSREEPPQNWAWPRRRTPGPGRGAWADCGGGDCGDGTRGRPPQPPKGLRMSWSRGSGEEGDGRWFKVKREPGAEAAQEPGAKDHARDDRWSASGSAAVVAGGRGRYGDEGRGREKRWRRRVVRLKTEREDHDDDEDAAAEGRVEDEDSVKSHVKDIIREVAEEQRGTPKSSQSEPCPRSPRGPPLRASCTPPPEQTIEVIVNGLPDCHQATARGQDPSSALGSGRNRCQIDDFEGVDTEDADLDSAAAGFRDVGLVRALLGHGVPVAALEKDDGFSRMGLVFCGRIMRVKEQSASEAKRVGAGMVKAWRTCGETYYSLRQRYRDARGRESGRAWKQSGPGRAAAEEAPPPPLMDLREKLHLILRTREKPRKAYRFSELVDLTMYYFNHIDGRAFSKGSP